MLHGRMANPPSKRIHAFAPLFLRSALRLWGCVRPKESNVFSPMMSLAVARIEQFRSSGHMGRADRARDVPYWSFRTLLPRAADRIARADHESSFLGSAPVSAMRSPGLLF